MSIEELTKIIKEENQKATEIYKDTADTYWQGRRDLADELLDRILEEEIQSIKDYAKALIAQKKIDRGELKLERIERDETND